MRVDRRIGGYTGDTLGAMEQICEITVLLVLCSLWRMP
jgi:cobalamin synthase